MIGISIATKWEFDATLAYFVSRPKKELPIRMVNISRER